MVKSNVNLPINQQIISALEKCLDTTPTGSKLLVPDDVPTDKAINQLQQFILRNREAVQDPDSERPLTFHGLRHTYAAEKYRQLIADGISELDAHLTVSQLLGHERAYVTNIYLASTQK
jgi:integrase